ERARVYHAQDRLEQTIADARRAVDLKLDYEEAAVLLFNTLYGMQRLDELEELFEHYEELTTDQIEPEARASLELARAWLHLSKDDREGALAAAEQAVAIAPQSWQVWLHRASFRELAGDERGAEQDCTRAAAFALTAPEDLVERAVLLRSFCHKPELVEADFTKAIDAAPWWADPYRYRGGLYRENGRLEDALADFNRAIELAPVWGAGYLGRGMTLSDLERFEESLADLERAAAIGVESWFEWEERYLLFTRVMAHLRLGRPQEALSLIEEALEHRPQSTNAHLTKVDALLMLGRVEEAQEAVERALEAAAASGAPPYFVAQLHLSRARCMLYRSQSCDAAVSDLDQVEQTIPPHFGLDLLSELASIHAEELFHHCPDRYDGRKALKLATSGVEKIEDVASLQSHLVKVLYREGRYDEAHRGLLRLRELRSRDAAGDLFYLAMTSWQLGRREEARRYYDRAVARLEATFPWEPRNVMRRREAARLLGLEPAADLDR
ncbi:MAG: tetratricopeptide repeat protein, partial [Acidobacteriota bacterium]